MSEIEVFQKLLPIIRKALGWTTQVFAEKLDVTRQTISNLERGKKMSRIQYIAMRSVIDAELEKYCDETRIVSALLEAFIDNPEKYTNDERKVMLNKAKALAPAIKDGELTRKEVSEEWQMAVMGVGAAVAGCAAIATSSTWLRRLLFDKR